MKKLTILILLLTAFVLPSMAQSQQELIEAYRNGTLTQSQMDMARKQQKKTAVSRTRQNTATKKTQGAEDMEYDEQMLQKMEQEKKAQQQKGIDPTNPIYQEYLKLQQRSFDPTRGSKQVEEDKLKIDSLLILMPELKNINERGAVRNRIFGQDMFKGGQATFEPNLNIATPDNYVLGPGDEVVIDTWGNAQTSENFTISPDGKIFVENVGPITLAGLTVSEATRRVRSSLAAIYEGLYDGSVQMKLSLGSIRSIQVNVMGEVGMTGTYTLPSLATLFHALYAANGVNSLGTLRGVKLYRNGKLQAEVDLYDYMLNGKSDEDVALRDGDLITVPAYGKLVEISGEVKRPMFFELRSGETVADLVEFAGGFTNNANANVVGVTRRQGGKYESFTVDGADFAKFVLEDGDAVSVAGSIDRYENRVEVRGAVYREGFYAIDDKTRTLKQLIARADGLREDAFKTRAVLYREKEDWTMEAQSIDLAGLMSGRVADIALRANDILLVASVLDMQEEYQVSIFGSVSRPDIYPYAEKMTVEDLIIAAGGLLEEASTANITVTRRMKDSKSLKVSEQLFETFTIDVNDDLAVKGAGFVLEPFDQVYVRRSPVYITQSSVEVQGEVPFAGNYPLGHRNMRLSEVIAAAGGVNPGAFVEGAYLLRKMTEEELQQNNALKDMIDKQSGNERDSLSMDGIELSDVYPVGVNLEQALANPGSAADIVLRDGDVISIPQYNGTVRVMGSVLYPNSVTFQPGKKLKYYVKSAGGFDNRARKSRAFVIYMNGMVESGMSAKVRPGSIIIIPSKVQTEPIKWSEVVGLVSSTASMSAVVISAISMATR